LKIALFCGSFNPFHLGHLRLGEYIIDNNLADALWYVVSPSNPLKVKSELINEHFRFDMVMAAIKGNDRLKACDIEFTMPIPSYSVDTLHKLSTLYPSHIFYLLIGSDNALIFDKWKNYKYILRDFEVLVYPRSGYDFRLVQHLYPSMKLLQSPKYEISSTQIRLLINQKKDVSQWLHPSVNQYIIENSLY